MKRPNKGRRNLSVLPPLTPSYEAPHQSAHVSEWHAYGDRVHQALAETLLDLRRDISGRDRRIATLEAQVRELRTLVKFRENAARLTAGAR